MDLGLGERVVLVTGGSAGIGRAAALMFAAEGARVAVTYFRHPENAYAVADQIKESGGEAMAVPLDLRSAESIRSAAQAVVGRWDRVDVLVNNAVDWGNREPLSASPFESVPSDEWRDLFRANFEGAYEAIQSVLPSMRAAQWGRIVNLSSGIAEDGLPGSAPYASAKAALHGLTRTLAKELGQDGILVNVVMPGATLTKRIVDMVPPDHLDKRASSYAIGRLLPPEEVVPAIVFLCSAVNTAVTGEIVRASGGRP